MKFMLLVYINPAARAEGDEAMAEYYALDETLRQTGELIRSKPLQPLDTAVRARARRPGEDHRRTGGWGDRVGSAATTSSSARTWHEPRRSPP